MVFTIAIPTFNGGGTLRNALKSCLEQKYEYEYEVLVVDNCSTDGTDKILDDFEGKISRIRNDKTVTQFENHNICITQAKGDYIVFCHSDDELLPDALTKFFNVLTIRNFPLKFVCWGRSMFRDFYPNYINGGYSLNQIAAGKDALRIFQLGGIAPSGTCYSVEAFKNLGGFIVMDHKMAPSDWVTMWILCLNHFEFEMSDRIFFKREFASTALTTSHEEVYLSIYNAVENFINTVDQKKVAIVMTEMLKFNARINLDFISVLRNLKVASSSLIKLKLLKLLITTPRYATNPKFYKLFF